MPNNKWFNLRNNKKEDKNLNKIKIKIYSMTNRKVKKIKKVGCLASYKTIID